MGAAATAYLVTRRYAPVSYRNPVTSLEIILILAGVPLAILVLLGLLTLRPNFARPRRYRPGQEWNYPPVLWTANPEALHEASGQRTGAARGGARGHW
jgi:hypothetical protein